MLLQYCSRQQWQKNADAIPPDSISMWTNAWVERDVATALERCSRSIEPDGDVGAPPQSHRYDKADIMAVASR
jgi:hypothetical protein